MCFNIKIHCLQQRHNVLYGEFHYTEFHYKDLLYYIAILEKKTLQTYFISFSPRLISPVHAMRLHF